MKRSDWVAVFVAFGAGIMIAAIAGYGLIHGMLGP